MTKEFWEKLLRVAKNDGTYVQLTAAINHFVNTYGQECSIPSIHKFYQYYDRNDVEQWYRSYFQRNVIYV